MRRGLYVLLGVLLVPTVGLVGDIVTDGKFKSTLSSGAPLEVASQGMVANFNADMVDGLEASDFASASDTYTKAEVDAMVAAVAAADARRWFYLTTTFPSGALADTVCDSGFHMASIYEILDVSNLRYDTGRGYVRDDSGQGPPQQVGGWVRTGAGSYAENSAGVSNCLAWTSSSASDFGTIAWLDYQMNETANKIHPWGVQAVDCFTVLPLTAGIVGAVVQVWRARRKSQRLGAAKP